MTDPIHEALMFELAVAGAIEHDCKAEMSNGEDGCDVCAERYERATTANKTHHNAPQQLTGDSYEDFRPLLNDQKGSVVL